MSIIIVTSIIAGIAPMLVLAIAAKLTEKSS